MTTFDSSVNQRFSSRLGLFLSVLGIAVGTGNIWRFPRIVSQNGGDEGAGAFLVAWVCFLFLWSIPLIIAEYAIGRKSRLGVVGAFAKVAGKKFSWMGAFVAFVSTAITFFYSVVVGWCIYYFVHTLSSPLPLTTDQAMAIWENYQSGGWPLLFHAIAMGLGMLAIWKGVTSIERVNKILLPTLLAIVLISVIRALTLPGSVAGIAYLFTPQWEQLASPTIWIEALTQNAWDTGAGWGLFLTYATYMKREHGVVRNAYMTAIGNNFVSLLAGVMVFGTVFAVLRTEMSMTQPEVLEIMRTSGPASTGLTFIWMPQLFARMTFGHPLAILFFLGLASAGFSSLIAQLELPSRILIDSGIKRPTAVGIVVGVSYLIGIPSAINLDILSNQDFVWGVALMISGAFVAFAVVKHGITQLREKELLADKKDMKLGAWWDLVLKYFVPIAATILLVWWLSQSPWEIVINCLIQWAVIMALLFVFNKRMFNQMKGALSLEHKD